MRSHSKLGIFSFGIGLAIGFAVLLAFIGSFIPESGTYSQQRYGGFLFVFALIIAPVFHFAGLAAGIIDAFRKNSKKIFPVFAIIINGISVLIAAICWLLILVVGIAVLSSGGGWR